MRPPVCGVLSAVVLVFAMLGAACSSTGTIDAAAPEAAATSGPGAQIESTESPESPEAPAPAAPETDRGAAVDPLPTAAPTATPVLVARQEEPPTARASEVRTDPLLWMRPSERAGPRLAPVDYTSVRSETVAPIRPLPDATVTVVGVTPDDRNLWLTLSDPAETATCPEGRVGSVLGIAPMGSNGLTRPAEPADELPPNVTAIFPGPSNHVLLHSSCGHYGAASALARVKPNGDFYDVKRITADTLFGYPPRWGYAVERDNTSGIDEAGSLVVVIPQKGHDPANEGSAGAADLFVEVHTGAILDVWPTQELLRVRVNGHVVHLTDEGLFASGRIVEWTGPVATLEARTGWDGTARELVAVGGSEGAMLVEFTYDDRDIIRVTDRWVEDLAWSPLGTWLALTGPEGTSLWSDGESIDLSNEPAHGVHFTSDGSRLVIAEAAGYRIIEFRTTQLPDDSNAVTAFSALNSAGLGPIRIGMTTSELEDVLDIEFKVDGIESVAPGDCVWIRSDELSRISMLGASTSETEAVVTALRIDSGPWITPSGLRIGSTEEQVFAALPGQVTQEPHAYIVGKYLTFRPVEPTDPYGVKFDTNGHEVIAITVGRPDWIRLIEGCA